MELATALVYGIEPAVAPLDVGRPSAHPRAVLESILVQALRRPPCVIGFSGGRDSSALLALAAHLARREGLEAPVAATNAFPGDSQAAESDWQELLVRHAGVHAWERLTFTDELDVIGPVATPLLERFGPTFPFNGHFGMPTMALATGGTYLTGVGGDELFEPNELTRLAIVLDGRNPPGRRDLPTILRRLGPERLRVRRFRRQLPAEPWLRPHVQWDLVGDLARTLSRQRLWYDDQIRHDIWRDRSRSALVATLTAFAATADVALVNPFQDAAFLRAVAAFQGRAGWWSRAAAMRELFGDVLPVEVVRRTTKATFDTIFFHAHSRDFVRDWDGSGVDDALVDVRRLRNAWERPAVDARSLSLLQAAWCHRRGCQPSAA
jgi:asparagine synthase (glutamine-hydrolysing)